MLGNIDVIPQLDRARESECSTLQLVATDAGKGLRAMEMTACVTLLVTVHVTLVVPAPTKKNPHGVFFLFAPQNMWRKNQAQTLLTTTYII